MEFLLPEIRTWAQWGQVFTDIELWTPYEWIAVWFDALNREPASMAACLAHYDPKIRLDGFFVERTMAYTLLHEFGAGIIRTSLKRFGDPGVSSVQELERVLWGALLPGGST